MEPDNAVKINRCNNDQHGELMKRYLLLAVMMVSPLSWASDSPELTQLVTELKAQYQKPKLIALEKRYMNQLEKLPYFLLHIDEKDTVEKIKLDAYLEGLQNGYYSALNRERDLNAPTWICMKNAMDLNPKKHPDLFKDLVWEVLDYTAKNDPQSFRRYNYSAAFGVPISSVIQYGLQMKYPCYQPIPKAHQLPGWKYD